MNQATATGWLCECGRTNLSNGCPRCGKKRGSEPRTPTRALPRNEGWKPGATPSGRDTKRLMPPAPAPVTSDEAAVLVGLPAERRTSWYEDFRFAVAAPLTGMGLIMMATGVILLLVASTPVTPWFVGIAALLTYVWLYHNYFFKTVQAASCGSDELPDSPMGYEAMGFFRLIWTLLVTYLGLALPILGAIAVIALVPALAKDTVPVILTAALWPIAAYPMTMLLVTHTKNPSTAFHYPSIVLSMVRTSGSYARLVGFFALLLVAPQVAAWFFHAPEEASGLGWLALTALHHAWTMYSMMALALFMGRFYVREKKTLGWFAG